MKIPNDSNQLYAKGIVGCIGCNECYVSKYGASILSKHKCIKAISGQQSITKFTKINKKDGLSVKIPQKGIDEICEQSLHFILNQMLAFRTIEGKEFRELLQKCINLGANYSEVDIKNVFCSRKWLCNSVLPQSYDKAIAKFTKETINLFKQFTLDFWSEEFKKMKYISLTSHFFSSSCNKLKSYILCSEEFPFEIKSAINFKEWFKSKLIEHNFNNTRYLVVTDNGSNLMSAFGDNRISCYVHSQNLALDFAMKTLTEIEIFKKVNKDFNEKISAIAKTCKELVSHFNHAELKNKLDKTLKPIISTRFNTHYEMFELIFANYDKICDVLETRGELHNYQLS